MLERSTVDWKSRQSVSLGETRGLSLNDALNLFLATGKAVVQQTWMRGCRSENERPACFEWHKMCREEI